MKVFITGGSGFVGQALIRKLAGHHEVVAMARSEKSAQKIREAGGTPVTCDLDVVSAVHLDGCQAVVHAAAYVEPWGRREDFWKANVEGTQRMLEAAAKAGVSRFIFVGTEAALFRGQDMVDIDESYPYPEQTPFLYSETKAEAERRVLAFDGTAGMKTLSIRPRLIWGPNDQTILKNLVEMVDSGAFRWIDQGKAQTSSCHIHNLTHAIGLALENGNGGQAYFITDGEDTDFRSFLTRYLQTAGRTPGTKNVPGWLAKALAWTVEAVWKTFGLKRKPPITRFSAAIMTANCTLRTDKASRELGYAPQIGVAEGMAQLRNA